MAATTSPLNKAIGLAVRDLRETRNVSVEECARRLRVSPTYLRSIEAGGAALPVYSIHGLVWEFGANFTLTTGLLSLVDFLDVREKSSASRSSNLQEIKERTAQVLLAEEMKVSKGKPQLQEVFVRLLKKTNEAIDTYLASQKDASESTSYERSMDGLKDIVDMLLSGPGIDPSNSASKRTDQEQRGFAPHDLSPVFEDVLDSLAARLALFPPHMSSSSFAKWEEKNSERIAGVFAYLSYPKDFIKIASRYGWGFLWNQHKPKVKIFIAPQMHKSAPALEKELRTVIRRIQPRSSKDISTQVTIDAIPARQEKLCADGLIFDFVSRSMPAPNEEPLVRKAAIDSQRYKPFFNVWLYVLHADTFDSDDTRLHRVGFLDTYQQDLANTYAVVLNGVHTTYWQQLFEACKK